MKAVRIAKYGGPAARTLFCNVLVASASVPGMFPPVIIRVQEDGMPRDEVHVDGGATVPFFVPEAFVQPSEAHGAPRLSVYVIVDGPMTEMTETTIRIEIAMTTGKAAAATGIAMAAMAGLTSCARLR